MLVLTLPGRVRGMIPVAAMTDDEDARLLSAYAAGDRAAFEPLIARHLDACWRFARRLTGEDAAADDVVQSAVVEMLRSATRRRAIGTVRGWMLAIVANVHRARARAWA
nr:hypothetical protein [Planctomycetota bacterium]